VKQVSNQDNLDVVMMDFHLVATHRKRDYLGPRKTGDKNPLIQFGNHEENNYWDLNLRKPYII